MQNLHAPWRINYILTPKPPDPNPTQSTFTQIAQSNNDQQNHVIHRGRHTFILLNRYPYNGGHLLIIPYKQTDNLNDLHPNELTEIMLMTRRAITALKTTMNPQGYNIGLNLGPIAGAGIHNHLHLHIVPRWQGDTNYMPITAQTNILPEALQETADKLRNAFPPPHPTNP